MSITNIKNNTISVAGKLFNDDAYSRFGSGCMFLNKCLEKFKIKIVHKWENDSIVVFVEGGNEEEKSSVLFTTMSWMLLSGIPVDAAEPQKFKQLYNMVASMESTPVLDSLRDAIEQSFSSLEKWK